MYDIVSKSLTYLQPPRDNYRQSDVYPFNIFSLYTQIFFPLELYVWFDLMFHLLSCMS